MNTMFLNTILVLCHCGTVLIELTSLPIHSLCHACSLLVTLPCITLE